MASAHVMTQIHKRMQVQTADGKSLGKIAHAWNGIDPTSSHQRCDEEECSRIEVHLAHRRGTHYIPYNAIAGVSGKTVNLNLDEETLNSKLWRQRPSWLPLEAANEDFDHLVRPHLEHGSS